MNYFTFKSKNVKKILDSLEYQATKKYGKREYALVFQLVPAYGTDYVNAGFALIDKSETRRVNKILMKRRLKNEEAEMLDKALKKLKITNPDKILEIE